MEEEALAAGADKGSSADDEESGGPRRDEDVVDGRVVSGKDKVLVAERAVAR